MPLEYMQSDSYTLFHERQSLIRSHFFVQALFFFLIILAWWGFIQQIVLGIPFGPNVATDAEILIIWIMAGWLIPALLLSMRLDIEVTQAELRFQYVPFHFSFQVIPCSSILQADVESYRSLFTHGWGIKYRSGVISYTVSGHEGVLITYLSPAGKEKKILLGSQSAFELERVLFKTMMSKNSLSKS